MYTLLYKNYLRKKISVPKKKIYKAVFTEFLYRSTYFFLCAVTSCTTAWIYGREILYVYLYPLYSIHQNIMFTSISEAFTTTLSLCISLGISASIPFFFYLFFCFFCTSLFPREKEKLYKACFSIVCAYIASIGFCGLYIIPELCCWFLKYEVSTSFLTVSLQAKASSYVSWSGKMYVLCVCILQIPNGILCASFFQDSSGKNGISYNSMGRFLRPCVLEKSNARQGSVQKTIVSCDKSRLPMRKQSRCIPYTATSAHALLSMDRQQSNNKKEATVPFFKGFLKNRAACSIFLLLLCASISPPDVYIQSSLFAGACGAYECTLWYQFLQETKAFHKEKKAQKWFY